MLVLAAVPRPPAPMLIPAPGPRLRPAPARNPAYAAPGPERLAGGAGRCAAHPRGAAEGAAGGGARPGGPPHLRALVPAARAALAAPLPRRRPRAARAPAAAGSRVHRRRRGATARLRPDQDAAAARPHLPRAHPGRNARRTRRAGSAPTRGARLRAPVRARVGILNRCTFHVPRSTNPESHPQSLTVAST